MFLDLQKHHTQHILPLIEKRLEVIKKRLLKIHGSDWYDYSDAQIITKCEELSDEFYRLIQAEDEIWRAIASLNRK